MNPKKLKKNLFIISIHPYRRQNLNRADNFLCDMVSNDMITIFISSTHQKYNISNCLYFFGGKLQTKGRI